MKISENVPIANLTTIKIGGPARYVIEVESLDDVLEAWRFANKRGLNIFILGDGANVIGRDEGFKGVILQNKMRGIESSYDENGTFLVRGMGGEKWDDIVEFACQSGYSGIEAMSAIPGTLGAAPVQNIGAYGQDISQVIENVEVFDLLTQQFVALSKESLGMGYRRSIFNSGETKGRYFIIAVTLRLRSGNLTPPLYASLQDYVNGHGVTDLSPASIRRMVMEIRASKLPDPAVEPSAGSFFKNIYLTDADADTVEARGVQVWRKPGENKVSAGWLLEECGLKGQVFHGMRVSEKSALVLINQYAKSYEDLARARYEIQQIIQTKFGLVLEQEPVEVPLK